MPSSFAFPLELLASGECVFLRFYPRFAKGFFRFLSRGLENPTSCLAVSFGLELADEPAQCEADDKGDETD